MSEDIQGPGFTIKDHRHFQNSDKNSSDQPGPIQDFKINFSTFILSLTSSAFYHLGEMSDPETKEKKVDLIAVKQTLDIIDMLHKKTEGNLSEEEKKLIEQLIYDLKIKYLNVQNKK